MATGMVAGLALALTAPSAAFALSAGCAAINSMGGTFTVDAGGNGTDKFTDRAIQPLANGEVVTYSWSGNSKGAYVYVLYTQNGSSQYAPASVMDSAAASGSGAFTFSSTVNNASVGDYFQVGLQDTDYFTTATPKPSARSSSVTITLSCTGVPTVTSVAPNNGPAAGGNSVVIAGASFLGTSGAGGVKFGATPAASYTVDSANQITAVAPAGTGTVDVTVTNGGVTSATSANDQYTYVAAPTVTAISPTAGPTAGGTTVIITGTGFSAANPTGAVKFGATNATYTINSNTQITATSPANSAGTYDITVTTTGGTSATSAADQFTYVAAPTVTSISPTAGPTGGGTSVTITGTGFSSATAVTFGGTAATGYTVNSATQITATAPAGVGTVDVRVTTVGGTSATSAADQYTFVAAPTVTSISPTAGPTGGGTSVVITGTGFSAANPTGAVKFGATNATYTINSNTQITATSPANSAGTYDITVTTAGGTSATSAADQFTYVAAPTVTSLSPTSGPQSGGTTVVLTGTGFSGADAVTFGGTAATGFTVNSGSMITATAPAGTGTVDVRVTTVGGTSATSAADQYTFIAAPTVTSISPPVGPTSGGGIVVLTGSNFTGVTGVSFGATPASGFTVISSSQINAVAPAGAAGTVDIRVTTAGGTSATSAADRYTYVPAPVVSDVSPSTGPISGGTSVVITGSGLSMTGMVTFGGVLGNFTVDGPNQITVVTPPHAAGAVDVAVTSAGGTGTMVGGFTYFVPTVVLPGSVANPTAGQAYSQSVSAPNAAFYNLTAGAFPPGVTLDNSTGALSGTPTVAGTFSFQITAGGQPGWASGSQVYTVTVAPPSLVLTDSGVGDGAVGHYYMNVVELYGGNAPYHYAVTAGALPTGLTLDASSGQISGTPTEGGSFNFTVTGSDSTGGGTFSASRAFTVAINAPTIVVAPASLPDATATAAYSQTLTAAGGTPGYSWAVTSGTLPAEITLSAGGVLSGTPTQPGTYVFTATATDSSTGTQYQGSQAYTLVVSAPTIALTPSSLPNATAGTAYSQTLSADGAVGPYTFALSAGALPPGLTLSGNAVSGTPTAVGTFNFTIRATDSSAGGGFAGAQTYSVTVGSPNFDLSPLSLPNGRQGEAFSQQITASGGTAPYTFTSTGTLPAGVTLGADGVLSGTPTQSGTFTFTVIARDSTTGAGAPFGVAFGYTWDVDVANPPVAAAASVNVAYDSAGTAIDLAPKVSGVADQVTIGTGPAHGTTSVAGFVVTYTPAAGYFGADSFTYTAGGPGGSSAPATVSLTVAVPPAPTVSNVSAAVPFNGAKAIDLTASVSGVYSSIAVAQAPAHGTTSVSGMVVTYTPATDHYGADSFTFTATGPGGASAPATVSLTVDNPPPPNPTPPAGPAQVVAGGDVGVTVTNTGGLATGVQITTPPAHGTVTVDPLVTAAAVHSSASGFVLTYTPNPGYSGPDSFAYALVGPGGTSQPQQVQVTVLPSVVLAPIEVSTLQGVPVQVDVTAGATGGPYTGAAVVSVGPNSAGTASFAQVGASRVMTFTPADDFTGVAVVTYTVSNANSTSAPSTVTVTVDARPNPALDADVRGLISAQVQAAQRFVDTQVQNFSQRNEQLHGQGDQEGPRKHALGLTFGFGDYAGGRPEDPAMDLRRREMPERPFADQARRLDEMAMAAADADASSPGGLGPIGGGKVALWSAGSIDFGQRHADAGGSKLKFTTSGVSLGADVEVADGLFVGVGAGYGYDATDIGSEGTRNASRSYMGAVYGSWRIAPQLYLDGVAGLGELSFDSRRIAANDATVIGRRDGSQAFGSLSLAFDHQDGPMTISSYGRVTVSKAKLDAFTETGDPVFALAYDAQDVDASFGTLGVRGQWNHALEDGSFTPRVRAEWRRQLSGADAALVRYADFLTGPSYQVDPLAQSQNTLLLGVGGDWRWDEGVSLSLDYEGQLGDESLSHRVTLKVSTRF